MMIDAADGDADGDAADGDADGDAADGDAADGVVALDDGLGGVKSCVSIKFRLSLLKTIGDKVGSLNSRMKTSGDDDAATDDVEGCGVMCADADVGVHTFDVAADDGGVEACVVAGDNDDEEDDCGVEGFNDISAGDDDDEEDACGVEGFNDIPAGAVDIDACGVEGYNEIPAGAE